MKKSLFTLALLCIAVVSFGGIFDLGVKAGMNSSKFTLNQSKADFISDAKAGYEFGGFMRMGGKYLYFQPEVNFVTKNSSSTYTTTSGNTTSTITATTKYSAVQVPLLAGIKFLDIKAASLHVITGPAISFAPKATIEDVKSELDNKSAWTWQLGAGVDLLIFSVNLRYEWGLSDFTLNNAAENIKNTVFKDGKTFTISLGIRIL
jgi:hypothetical protein